MSHGGKGDTPRPYSVDANTFANNWDAIFGKKKKEVSNEALEVYNDERLVSKFDKQNGEHLPKDSEQGG
jgi:hypothetical protein